MKILLTSKGLANETIAEALEELVGKPRQEIKIVFVPTAAICYNGNKKWLIDDLTAVSNYAGYVDVLSLDAQQDRAEWLPRMEQADVLYFSGGSHYYLSYWMDKSGFFDELPQLLDQGKVYVGSSAGSMVVTDHMVKNEQAFKERGEYTDDEYQETGPAGKSLDKTAKLVPFVLRVHLNSPKFLNITEEKIVEVAKTEKSPIYAIDDNSAIQVVDDKLTVISEGQWKLFNK